MPAVKHQRVGARLARILDDAVFAEGMEAVTAVTAVGVANVALVVEIVSPSTKKSDRLEKPAALAAGTISVAFDPADLHKPRR